MEGEQKEKKIIYRTIEEKRHSKDSSGFGSSAVVSDHDINMYSVIIDANYPYNTKHVKGASKPHSLQNKFLCAIKVIDYSLFSDKEPSKGMKQSYATIVVVGERIEDMPIIRRIGDIIRIQKATMKIKENIKQFIVDENSNWCLFGPDNLGPDDKIKTSQIQFEEFGAEDGPEKEEINIKRNCMPYKYSGKNFSFVEGEEIILNTIRTWGKYFFLKHEKAESLLLSFSSENDKSILCKVMKVYDNEEDNYWIRVKEKDGTCWKVCVDKIKYPELQKDEIVRIKSAKSTKDKGVLELKPHSNILKLMKDCKIDKNLSISIKDNDFDKVIQDCEEPQSELIVTEKKDYFSSFKLSTILQIHFPQEYKCVHPNEDTCNSKEEIKSEESSEHFEIQDKRKFDSEDNISEDENRYLLKFNIVWYDPNDIREFVKAYCENCNTSFSLRDIPNSSKIRCSSPKCKKECKLVYMVKFLVKDEETFDTRFLYPVLLYSRVNPILDDFFFGLKPTNLYENKEILEKLTKYCKYSVEHIN